MGWLGGWLRGWLAAWLAWWLGGWVVGGVACWVAGWRAGGLARCWAGLPVGLLAGCLAGWLGVGRSREEEGQHGGSGGRCVEIFSGSLHVREAPEERGARSREATTRELSSERGARTGAICRKSRGFSRTSGFRTRSAGSRTSAGRSSYKESRTSSLFISNLGRRADTRGEVGLPSSARGGAICACVVCELRLHGARFVLPLFGKT